MSDCSHDGNEKEMAVAFDAICPLCLQSALARLTSELATSKRRAEEYRELYVKSLPAMNADLETCRK